MKQIQIGSVSIPLDAYAVGGTALLGIRESGKTYTAKGIAEQLMDHGVPIIVFDAIGMWRWLKVPGAGPKGKGYPIVVAGGREPDLPLTPDSAPQIVRAAIRENIPIVFDFYSKELSKADWRRIVQRCFKTLLYENEGVRHIFLEETAEFAPQKVMDGETYAEVEKLVRMGGNASLGITLINQRSQEVNKAILDLCENLVLMRQRGSNAINVLEKWMDRISPTYAQKIAEELPNMRQGDAWVFAGDQETPVRTRSALIHTFHPDRRKPELLKKAGKPADVHAFVGTMLTVLDEVIEKAKQDDPRLLRQQIAELQKQLKARLPAGDPTAVPRARFEQLEMRFKQVKQYAVAMKEFRAQLRVAAAALAKLDTIADVPPLPDLPAQELLPATAPASVKWGNANGRPVRQPPSAPSDLKPGEAKTLETVIGFTASGVDRSALSVITSYARSTRDAYIARLMARGYVTERGSLLYATAEGLMAMPYARPLPSGLELQEFWRHKLPTGEARVLELLIGSHGTPVARETISQETNFARSTRDAYLQRLIAKQLVIDAGNAQVRAADTLF